MTETLSPLPRFGRVFKRQAWTLLAVFVLTGLIFAFLGWLVARQHVDVSAQQLNRDLAARIVSDNELLYEDGSMLNYAAIKETFDHYMHVNPAIEIYQLDATGKIIAFSADPGIVQRTRVDLAPIDAFISNMQALPILGEDPKGPNRRKIFSATPLSATNPELGYLYVILRGQAVDVVERAFGDSFVFKALAIALATSLALGLAASLIIFRLLGRRLESLANKMALLGDQPNDRSEAPTLPNPNVDEIGALESTFSAMSERINNQMTELHDKDHKRREFLAHISHDLRTPLTVMNTNLESLDIRYDQLDDAQRLDHIDTARREGSRLTELVNDLFQLARLDTGQDSNTLEPVSIVDLIQDVAHKHAVSCRNAGIRLTANSDKNLPLVDGNVALIERMLDNLVSNAIAHTPRDGNIDISASANSGKVKVTVADSGPGVPACDHARIFDPGFRGSADKSNPDRSSGAGLGLAISRKIADWHHGELTLADNASGGARFEFTLAPVRSARYNPTEAT